jgi:hypothetical protein
MAQYVYVNSESNNQTPKTPDSSENFSGKMQSLVNWIPARTKGNIGYKIILFFDSVMTTFQSHLVDQKKAVETAKFSGYSFTIEMIHDSEETVIMKEEVSEVVKKHRQKSIGWSVVFVIIIELTHTLILWEVDAEETTLASSLKTHYIIVWSSYRFMANGWTVKICMIIPRKLWHLDLHEFGH